MTNTEVTAVVPTLCEDVKDVEVVLGLVVLGLMLVALVVV